VQVLKAFFGAHRDVRTITELDLAQYTAKRKAGGIQCEGDRKTGRVRQSTVHRDIGTLRTMMRWARTLVTPEGGRWLDHDPLDRLRFPKEKNPTRPVSSRDRYLKTRAAVRELAAKATSERDRLRWVRLEFALFLANTTGRRRGAIVGLRVEDFDFTTNQITWRAEYDKKGVEWIVPMPARVMAEIRRFLNRLDCTSGFVFPSKRNPSGHIPADMLGEWLRAGEAAAKLPKLKGGLWHPYRRKWASERMDLPLKAVAAAGGWKDEATLIRCYQHPDEDMLRRVVANDRVRRRGAAAGAAA
jgi:integrase